LVVVPLSLQISKSRQVAKPSNSGPASHSLPNEPSFALADRPEPKRSSHHVCRHIQRASQAFSAVHSAITAESRLPLTPKDVAIDPERSYWSLSTCRPWYRFGSSKITIHSSREWILDQPKHDHHRVPLVNVKRGFLHYDVLVVVNNNTVELQYYGSFSLCLKSSVRPATL